MSATTSHSAIDGSKQGTVAFGVAAFAGIMLVTLSLFQILEGVAAIAEDTIYVTGGSYIYELNVTTWGWIHLGVGVIGLVVGTGILMTKAWAFVAGIAIAVVSAIANFTFLPFYPFWAVLIIAFDVFVIWALARQLSSERGWSS